MQSVSRNGFPNFHVVEPSEEDSFDFVKVFQLESYSKNREALEDKAESLMQGRGLDVSEYRVLKKESVYALYIR